MIFEEDEKLEELFYDKIFKKYLEKQNIDTIFVRYNEPNSLYSKIQKKLDIDIIADNGMKNVSYSLKTVKNIYQWQDKKNGKHTYRIFFETISNMNTMSAGWGYYSKADWHVYTMGFPEYKAEMFSIFFNINDIRKLNIENEEYDKGYGETKNSNGKLLYKTEGRLIPLTHFPNKIINLK